MKVLFTNQIMNFAPLSLREISQGRDKCQARHLFYDQEIKHFDWAKRWLKGDEYAHILSNIDLYCDKFGFQKFDFKCHPESIYNNPINGLIYFVKGKSVGSDFGFPRVSTKKKYRWKKMNFTTELPKKRPFVTYVVASAMKANMIQTNAELPDYRMHAVIPYVQSSAKDSYASQYILCHVRQVEHKVNGQQQVSLETCFVRGHPDFYKLFMRLHNLQQNACHR